MKQFSRIFTLYLVVLSPLFLACNQKEKSERKKNIIHSQAAQTPQKPDQRISLTKGSDSRNLDINIQQLNQLQYLLDSFAQYRLNDPTIHELAIHFTHLGSGKQFNINPDLKFVPASLLKIAILIAIYKYEEEKPGTLKREINHQHTLQTGVDYRYIENEEFHYQPHKRYTVQEYLNCMIRYSDNDATLSLLMFLNAEKPGFIEQVEKDLHSSIPNSGKNLDDIVQVGHFSGQLKALYEANYLNLNHSEEALRILSSSRYPEGFRKKLPAHLTIAHKFGVRFNTADAQARNPIQLHQVALVYHPKSPFILTVMTKGKKIEALRLCLQDAALLTYTYLDDLAD